MAAFSPELEQHKAWLGYLQPEGLVVTAQTLLDAGVQIDRSQLGPLQARFNALVTPLSLGDDKEAPGIANLPLFLEEFLGWLPDHLVGEHRREPVPEDLIVALPDFEETLSPTSALRKFQPKPDETPWSLLIQRVPAGQDLDQPRASHTRGWEASPTRKFERLLRETRVHVGLLCNGLQFRLVYAPAKENAGYITFPVQAMTEVGGRPILGAFHLLLGAQSVLNAPDKRHLHRLLAQSREYQATVSEKLAEQVLTALHELLRGFQSANDLSQGHILRHPLAHNPNQIYEGLLTVLLRMVFLLFAEDRTLMPAGTVYSNHYSLHALFEKLRRDAEKHADHMDDRFGAWARLLAVFRIVHQGCRHGALQMPPRHGHLFDPERFPFLEGREPLAQASPDNLPMVSDGVLLRVLTNLLILDGERVSYRTLDVEEIGSVYQTIMGFGILVSPGTAIALKGKRKKGGVPAAPIVVLEDLLAQPTKDRPKWLKEKADHELTDEAEKALKAATSVDEALAALANRIDRMATPGPVHQGRLVLEPTDERRRSGSHYTPRSLTEPIVRKTLEPILQRLGQPTTPAQILDLKICDIAVGSAAFLVEACRQLAELLVHAWRVHGGRPPLPPDETEELLAMRLIAQRCLYGVDRNPMAVDLAKLSLWLVTLAKDHPFTFLDHCIRCGDSLVGLTRQQIEDFTWQSPQASQRHLFSEQVRTRTANALRERQNLLGLGDDQGSPQLKREKLAKADELLDLVRFIGDAVIAAFFAADKPKAREAKRVELAERISEYLRTMNIKLRPTAEVNALRGKSQGGSGKAGSPSSLFPSPSSHPVTPFHWEIEYPEVFDRENPGFDGIVGNPPFLGAKLVLASCGENYGDFLRASFRGAKGAADLVAFFFRQAFQLLKSQGVFGLIATNTISETDTRVNGLEAILEQGGIIFNADTSVEWPGQATVVVSVICVAKAMAGIEARLDGAPCERITSGLSMGLDFSRIVKLQPVARFSAGVVLYGESFIRKDSELAMLREKNPGIAPFLRPYVNGDVLNGIPDDSSNLYVVDFGEREESEIHGCEDILESLKVSVGEERKDQTHQIHETRNWLHWDKRTEFMTFASQLPRLLVCSTPSTHLSFKFCPASHFFMHNIVVFAESQHAFFAVMQSRPHFLWAEQTASTLGRALRYSTTAVFRTFPFPAGFETNAALEAAGREYYEFRAALMQDLWLGLTEIYNLFHSPDDEALARLEALYRKRAATSDWRTAESVPADRSPLTLYATPAAALAAVQRLRTLHAAMDAAVLTAYGWADLIPRCTSEFLLDYQDEDSDESTGRRKKRPWRYRWPDEIRDEVLARLLKLNAERAEQERRQGVGTAATAPAPASAPKRKKVRKNKPSDDSPTLNLGA